MCGDTGETGELQKICFLVSNDTRIRSWVFKSNHQRSVVTVVTYDGHVNSILVRQDFDNDKEKNTESNATKIIAYWSSLYSWVAPSRIKKNDLNNFCKMIP